ncbi:hypothetical protein JOB18_049455 [Solea senegalensis]|uniref:Uncharacterized protein n=1 Tax=Solea senegalensis TaxID=28829 RepID=A0AAV6S0U5_SOLSE|nr:hypothetical protein JOB18_049455 [Solea senegalensis]
MHRASSCSSAEDALQPQVLGQSLQKSPAWSSSALLEMYCQFDFHLNGCCGGTGLAFRDSVFLFSLFHLVSADSCSSRGLASLSGVLTLSVLTIQVGRCRLSITISCCLSIRSSSIWAFRSEFTISRRSDSWTDMLNYKLLLEKYVAAASITSRVQRGNVSCQHEILTLLNTSAPCDPHVEDEVAEDE